MFEGSQSILSIELSKDASLIKVSPAPENMTVNNVESSELDLNGYVNTNNASKCQDLQKSSSQIEGKDGNATSKSSKQQIIIDVNRVIQDNGDTCTLV